MREFKSEGCVPYDRSTVRSVSPGTSRPSNGVRPDVLKREITQIYEDCSAGLYRYGYTLTRNEDLARDALQEAFLRFFITRQDGAEIREPKAWLYRVLRNHLLDGFRSHASREIGIDELRESPDRTQNPEASYQHTEVTRRLYGALSPRELECLRLRAEGLSYDEIAGVLGIRQGTVGALLARAHKKVRQEMDRATAPASATRSGNCLMARGGTPYAS